MNFKELHQSLQEKILSLGFAYYTIRGDKDPQKKIEAFISKDRKNKRVWRTQLYMKFMRGIDFHRTKMGLEKLYTEDK